MRNNSRILDGTAVWLVIACLVVMPACTKKTAKSAGKGAVIGGVVGAVGGLVTGLVFGGNPAESAARGAVYGASTGATAAAISSAMEDSAGKEQQDAEMAKLKERIGEDAFSGLKALAECKHEVALAFARTAAQRKEENYALAGLWLEVLTYADSRQESKARELFPAIVGKDPKIDSEAQAEETMRKASQKLMDIRESYSLPRICGS
ncbi:MAG: hypothetical protein ACOZF0_07510 [Thermodesulfobacteriota bacterium]